MSTLKYNLLLMQILLCSVISSSSRAIDIGDTAPNWRLQNGSGEQVDYYRDSKDKVSVLIYWATWCPYCASLMPHLQDVANQYEGDEVVFYAMNIIEDSDPVQFMKQRDYTFKLILKADPTMDDYNVPGTPGVFVIDADHRVLYRRIPDTPDEEVKNAVTQAIDRALRDM